MFRFCLFHFSDKWLLKYYYSFQLPVDSEKSPTSGICCSDFESCGCFHYNSRYCLIPLLKNYWSENVHVAYYFLTILRHNISLPIPAFKGYLNSLAHAPLIIITPSSTASSNLFDILPCPQKAPCDYTGPIWKNQDK